LEFGTPVERILCAHKNDKLAHVMSNMRKNGYSHVPVMEKGKICGVLSIRSIFDYLAEEGLECLHSDSRIADLGDAISLERNIGVRYLFMPENTNIEAVRAAFERYTDKNRRISAVFISKNGTEDDELICILTPWDVMKDMPKAQSEGV